MPIQILMPALSPTMTEGNLARWLVKEGEAVSAGTLIAEIETDKATMELEAVDEGTMGKILVPAGTQGVAVNAPIALLLEEGEDASALTASAAPAASAAAPAPKAPAPAAEVPMAGLAMGFGGFDVAAPKPAPSGGRVFASPLARRIAAEAGIDLSRIRGSGPKGRIVRADVEAAKASGDGIDAELEAAMALASAIKPPAAAAPAPKPPVAALPAADAPFAEVPHSTMRKVIARRLTESKQTVPHFYVTMEVVLDDLLALREQINARVQKTGGPKVSVNDFIIRASALALKRMPEANVSWTDEAMRMYSRSDVSVAVATPAGLITPIVRGAEAKSLGAVSDEMRDLAARARDGKLKPEEYQGGTFSISNLGMYGVREFAAIINPPQSMLLAVGASEPRPVARDGALAIANAMNLTLSCDHRCIDGALGAKFLGLVKSLLEDPISILL